MPAVTSTDPDLNKQNLQNQQGTAGAGTGATGTQTATGGSIPYIQDPNQPIPIIAPPKPAAAPATEAQVGQQNTEVMSAAQQAALAGTQQPNATMGLVQSGVQDLLKNPSTYQPGFVQNQLEQYDRNRAQSMDANQQALGDVAHSGASLDKMYNLAMQGAQGRSDEENKLQQQKAQDDRDALLKALAMGQDVSKTQSGLDTTAFQNLIQARGAYEGERSQTQGFQDDVALSNLGFDHATQMAAQQNGYDLNKLNTQFGNDMAKMVANQDWQGAQSQMDREAAVAAQSTDIAAKQAFAAKQQEYDLVKLNSQLSADMQKMVAQNDFAGAQASLDRDLKTAMQTNDINAQKDIQAKQIDLQNYQFSHVPAQTQAELDNRLQISNNQIASDQTIQANKDKLTAMGIDVTRAQLEGYTDPTTGQHVMGTAELSAQGLTLDTAKIQGYTDPTTGKHVMGELEIAQGQFGLSSKTVEDQEKELYGYTDPTTGQHIAGKIETLSDADKQAADGLYGYTDPATGQHVLGKLELDKYATDTSADTQKWVAQQRINADLEMQTKGFTQEQSMAYLNSQLAEAKANNDVGRQEQIMSFQTQQTFQTMAAQNGYDVAMENLKGDIQKDVANNDTLNAEAKMQYQWTMESQQRTIDNAARQAGIDLEAKGVDMKAAEQTYEQLVAEVQAGRADPSTVTQYVNGVLSKAGVEVVPPDPNATQIAAQKQYSDMTNAYFLSHPGDMNYNYKGQDVDSKVLTAQANNLDYIEIPYTPDMWHPTTTIQVKIADLTKSPKDPTQFNQYLNSTLYGELTPAQQAAQDNAGALDASQLGNAQAGDTFNITAATTYNGTAVPAGKYSVVVENGTTGNSFTGSNNTSTTYLVSADGTKIKLGHTTAPMQYGLLESALDPGGFFKGSMS